MSTITKEWTLDKIRDIIKNLDSKTGLSGAELEIDLSYDNEEMGCFDHSTDKWVFRFNLVNFNKPDFKELAVIEVIRHEYAHYYNHVAEINKWLFGCKKKSAHSVDWEFACKMLNLQPNKYYSGDYYTDKDITLQQANEMCMACDVENIKIIDYIKRWDRLPLTRKEHETASHKLKALIGEEKMFKPLDLVEHILYGRGLVIDERPGSNYQMVYVCFAGEGYKVLNSKSLKAC